MQQFYHSSCNQFKKKYWQFARNPSYHVCVATALWIKENYFQGVYCSIRYGIPHDNLVEENGIRRTVEESELANKEKEFQIKGVY